VTAVGSEQRFRLLPPDDGANALEEELLARWHEEGLFARTLEAHADATSWVFFEGPPTANGRPGIHHVFARTIKDLFCRHRAMSGFRVLRKAGWDTHGLPVEIEVEKQLPALLRARGMSEEEIARYSGKPLIEAFGVEEFNRLCRESVWKYQGDWETLSERIGYWLDYDDPYVTYTPEYVESVWWALSTLYRKGLLYRGHKILPYCARCGTALSSHEVAQGYEDVDDPSVYVALDLGSVGGEVVADADGMPGRTARRILVWTTTPWTLTSNVGAAVNPDLTYLQVKLKGEVYYVAKGAFKLDRMASSGGGETGDRVALEVEESWRVDQVDLRVHPLGVRATEVDGVAALDLFGGRVGEGGAVRDGAVAFT